MSKEEILRNVPGLPEDEEVVIRKLGMGSLTKLRSKVVITDMSNLSSPNASVDIGLYTKWLLLYGIKEMKCFTPFRTIEEKERAFDNDIMEAETGEYLFQKIQQLNRFQGVEDLKKKSN